MGTQGLYIIIGFIALSSVFSIIYFLLAKKKNAKKVQEANQRVLSTYNDPNTAKVALWVDLESVNGKPFDDAMVYYTKVKSKMTGMSQEVEVALFQPGAYTFMVNSREYTNVAMSVDIELGKVYQLGADEDGPYFIEDPDGARYAMKEI